jgi:hypothetical protein
MATIRANQQNFSTVPIAFTISVVANVFFHYYKLFILELTVLTTIPLLLHLYLPLYIILLQIRFSYVVRTKHFIDKFCDIFCMGSLFVRSLRSFKKCI